MKELKDKKKLKKKKTPMGEKLAQLKNGAGKKKLKKELVKNKMKPGRKEKVNSKVIRSIFKLKHDPNCATYYMFSALCLTLEENRLLTTAWR